MGTVAYSGQSQTDIIDIWVQLAVRSRTIADTCLDKIEARCNQLADFPELGPYRRDIAEHARALLVDRGLIVYRIIDDGVLVVRVVDSARDLSKLNLPHE